MHFQSSMYAACLYIYYIYTATDAMQGRLNDNILFQFANIYFSSKIVAIQFSQHDKCIKRISNLTNQ